MTNDVDITLVGDEELMKALTSLEYKTQQKTLKKVVSNAANIMVKAGRQAASKRSDNVLKGNKKYWHPAGLAKGSVGKKAGKSKKNAVVFVGPKGPADGGDRDPWYYKFHEFGAYGKNRTLKLTKAYELNAKKVEDNIFKSIRTIIEREMNKARKIGNL